MITGAGSGIGRATARIFAAEGARVVVSDVDETSGDETVNLKGVWLCMKAEIQQFLDQDSAGAIVSTASIAGLVAATMTAAITLTGSSHN
ncbi:MAG: SDR family NAD(P)-dependent oxidoreductase [Porticoccaceae bacterium]